jgi:hypothetical protein
MSNKRLFNKYIAIMIFAFIIMSLLVSYIPSFFYSHTSATIEKDIIEDYQNEYDQEYSRLLDDYENQMESYNSEMLQYNNAQKEYEANKAKHQDELKKYEDEYNESIIKYESELEEYNEAQVFFNETYSAEYQKAEEKALEEGIPFNIKVTSICIEDGNIGNDWTKTFTVNGDERETILKAGSKAVLKSKIIEEDSVPDKGSESSSYVVTYDDMKNGFEISHTVSVRENRGPNSGNKTVFEVTYTLTPQEYEIVVDRSLLPQRPVAPIRPNYNPPVFNDEEPIAPTSPSYPSESQVRVIEPDLDLIEISDEEVYNNNPLANGLRSIILAIGLSLTVYCGIKAYRVHKVIKEEENQIRIAKELEEQERKRREEEARLERIRREEEARLEQKRKKKLSYKIAHSALGEKITSIKLPINNESLDKAKRFIDKVPIDNRKKKRKNNK